MTIGDHLRMMATQADHNPEWTGIAVVICPTDIMTWTSSEVSGDKAEDLVRTLDMTVNWAKND